MARGNLERVMPHIFAHEGGYVDHPKDPGGATNMGITFATLKAWRGKPITKADVRTLKRAEATEIYRVKYWDAIKGDSLPSGIDYATLDFAVNSGVSRAKKFLQRALNVKDDGIIGKHTLAVAQTSNAEEIVHRICGARLAYLTGLKGWDTFGKGWQRRVADVRNIALQLAKNKPVEEPPVIIPKIEPPVPDAPPPDSEPEKDGWLMRFFHWLFRAKP